MCVGKHMEGGQTREMVSCWGNEDGSFFLVKRVLSGYKCLKIQKEGMILDVSRSSQVPIKGEVVVMGVCIE